MIQREIDVWKRLRHPNILEFFGACSIADPPFLVCAFKENGDVINYINHNPEANRQQLVRVAGIKFTWSLIKIISICSCMMHPADSFIYTIIT